MPDSLLIERGTAKLVTDEGQVYEKPESALVDMMREAVVPPVDGVALPDGVKFLEYREPYLLVVHQQPPHVRQLRWITNDSPAGYGSGAVYRKVRLSLPYAVMFAMFVKSEKGALPLCDNHELYFSNRPVTSKKDRTLGFPALLNVSVVHGQGGRKKTWMCTQYLKQQARWNWTRRLDALLEHLWNGGFNLSSEAHEGVSWYTASAEAPGIHPVEAWEENSRKDDAFGLKVNWLPCPHSVGELIDLNFREYGQEARATRVSLVSRFLNYAQKK